MTQFQLCKECFIDKFLYFVILQTGAVHTDYYHDSDLTLGTVLNVWGRKFRICDCDEFTKEYYKSKYGLRKLSQFTIFDNLLLVVGIF